MLKCAIHNSTIIALVVALWKSICKCIIPYHNWYNRNAPTDTSTRQFLLSLSLSIAHCLSLFLSLPMYFARALMHQLQFRDMARDPNWTVAVATTSSKFRCFIDRYQCVCVIKRAKNLQYGFFTSNILSLSLFLSLAYIFVCHLKSIYLLLRSRGVQMFFFSTVQVKRES